jgi:FMN-dependent NADH-azoreductase
VPKLLHLRCSPRANSVSSGEAEAFTSAFLRRLPAWDLDLMDLWRERIPEFDGAALEAKYARQEGRAFTADQQNAFAEIERMVVRLSLADRLLISTPMWNFGIPYKLKQFFDLIIQPGLTFRFEPERGYTALLRDRPTIVIMASGSDFVTGMNRGRTDMATPYLREALRFIGIRDVRFVPVGPTTGPAPPIKAARETARRRLEDLAAVF